MGLFSRSSAPQEPRPARVAKPKIRLRPEELKASMALRAKERLGAYAMGVYMVGAALAITVPGGLKGVETKWLVVGLIMAVLVVVGARFASRFVAIITCVVCSIWPGWTLSKDKGRNALFAYPFLAFVLYLTFAMSKARRDITERRVAEGDFGDPAAERRAAKTKVERATVDATGRDLAARSKRYTPPKKKAPAKSSGKR